MWTWGALLQTVHHSDGKRHLLHKLDKQAISLYFVSGAVEDVDGHEDRDGRVALQLVQTGYTLKVVERERRTCVWTSAPCT